MMRKVFIIFSILLLVYLLAPGPNSIKSFSDLPNSAKSDLPGDTVQVPNVAGYFSNQYRSDVTNFYKLSYKNLTWLPFLPIRLNYPPEFAYTAIKDQTQSTYLEELVYPLRDSLFINGFEPFYQDGTIKFPGADLLGFQGSYYQTKATIRFYPSPIWVRALVWLGIIGSIYFLWKLYKKSLAI